MPTRVKILWVFCNIVIFFGFIIFSYASKVQKAQLAEVQREKLAQEREKEKKALEKFKKENQVPITDPLKTVKEFNALGKHQEAADLAQKLAEMNPGNSQVFTWWGISLVKSGLRSAAIEKFVRAAELDPTNFQAFLYWGLTLAMEARFKDAIEKYKVVIELDPENSNAYAYIGASQDQLRQYDEAIENLKRALDLNPSSSTAYELLVQTLYHSGDFAEAWKTVASARKANAAVSEKVLQPLSEAMPEPAEKF